MFNTVAIIGLGLIGGSIARMLKKKNHEIVISAYGRNPELLQSAKEEGIIDNIGSINKIDCSGVDLFIVATPVLSSIDLIQSLLSSDDLKNEALIIDAGSVKQSIIDAIIAHDKACQFIGCHPMAGSEKSGYQYSSHSLLGNAWVIITPHDKNKESDIKKIEAFWKMLECNTIIIDAQLHDTGVAYSSHLPHIASTALVDSFDSITNNTYSTIEPFIGKGFRDMTRLAGGKPDMWADIVLLNHGNIVNALDSYINSLLHIKSIMQQAAQTNDRTLLYRYFATIRQKWEKYNE
ncbi:MAG TPA: prephenate dehydrogenase [Spirochaetota bacterium]|nr:prephenate dehydrogenase [Spirochaetota bacterium]HPD04897.1 prephenate dehydrogenase [Spirochaetota bacterium]HQK08019.1 prephenate dehydrogenase [Spirochaetota bacterium]HRR60324.1 prephenate dehydrogenase [Spirochaetota bacterium]